MGDSSDGLGVPVEGHHLKVQRIELPMGASGTNMDLVRLRTRLKVEQAKRRAAERNVENLKRGSVELMRTVTMLQQRTREEELEALGRELRRRQLDLDRRAADLEERNEGLSVLGAYLAEQFEVLDGAREGRRLPHASGAALHERVLGQRESEVVRRERELEQQSGLLRAAKTLQHAPLGQSLFIDPAELPESLAGLDFGALDEATIVALFVNSIQAKSESVRKRLETHADVARQVGEKARATEAEAQREAMASFEKMLGVEITLRQHAEGAAEKAERELERVVSELNVRRAREPNLYREIDQDLARIAELERTLEVFRSDRDRFAAQLEIERESHEERRGDYESAKRLNESSLARRKEVERALGIIQSDFVTTKNLLRRKEKEAEAAARELGEMRRRAVAAEARGESLETETVAQQRDAMASERRRASLTRRLSEEVGGRLAVEERAEGLVGELGRLAIQIRASEAARGRAEEGQAALEAEVRKLTERVKAEESGGQEGRAKAAPAMAQLSSLQGPQEGAKMGGQGAREFLTPLKGAFVAARPEVPPPFAMQAPERLELDLRLRFMMKDIDEIRVRLGRPAETSSSSKAPWLLGVGWAALEAGTRGAADVLRKLRVSAGRLTHDALPRLERTLGELSVRLRRSLP